MASIVCSFDVSLIDFDSFGQVTMCEATMAHASEW